ncbi:MAG: hypothetical protein RL885_29655 [Planctomycetota bacterium]
MIAKWLTAGVLAGVVLAMGACRAPAPSPEIGAAPEAADSPAAQASLARQRAPEPGPVRWAILQEDELPPDETVRDRGEAYRDDPRTPHTSAGFGLGGTFDPDTFLITGHADFYLSDHVAIGPLLQVGVDDDYTIIAPSFTLKGSVDVETAGPRLRPFVLGGVGFAFIEDDGRPRFKDDDDIGVMLNAGIGIDLFIAEDISIGASVIVNVLPGEVLDETLFVSLQVLTIDLHF